MQRRIRLMAAPARARRPCEVSEDPEPSRATPAGRPRTPDPSPHRPVHGRAPWRTRRANLNLGEVYTAWFQVQVPLRGIARLQGHVWVEALVPCRTANMGTTRHTSVAAAMIAAILMAVTSTSSTGLHPARAPNSTAASIRVRAVRQPHLNGDTPLKPHDMQLASFDKAGKAIMNLAAEGGHGARVELKAGVEFTVHVNHSCIFPYTTLHHPITVATLPDSSGLVRADGGPHYYWIDELPEGLMPAWALNLTCGVFVRQKDVELVKH